MPSISKYWLHDAHFTTASGGVSFKIFVLNVAMSPFCLSVHSGSITYTAKWCPTWATFHSSVPCCLTILSKVIQQESIPQTMGVLVPVRLCTSFWGPQPTSAVWGLWHRQRHCPTLLLQRMKTFLPESSVPSLPRLDAQMEKMLISCQVRNHSWIAYRRYISTPKLHMSTSIPYDPPINISGAEQVKTDHHLFTAVIWRPNLSSKSLAWL